jgi:hypothetical protein
MSRKPGEFFSMTIFSIGGDAAAIAESSTATPLENSVKRAAEEQKIVNTFTDKVLQSLLSEPSCRFAMSEWISAGRPLDQIPVCQYFGNQAMGYGSMGYGAIIRRPTKPSITWYPIIDDKLVVKFKSESEIQGGVGGSVELTTAF